MLLSLIMAGAVTIDPPIVGRPVDFSGAVGGPFVVTMTIEPAEVAVEEPMTLSLSIAGPGNLQAIARPALGKLPGFQPFAVDDLDDAFTDGSPPSRNFRYRLRARSPSSTQIPSVRFVYFNPAIVPPSRGYQTTYADGLTIVVKPAKTESDGLAREIADLQYRLADDPGNPKWTAQLSAARDRVRYPHPMMRPVERGSTAWLRWLVWAFLVVGIVIVAVSLPRRRIGVMCFGAIASIISGVLFQVEQELRVMPKPLVVVGREVMLRRGNGDAYPPRMDSPLPPGVEASKLFERGSWLQVELANGVVGWLPAEAVIATRRAGH